MRFSLVLATVGRTTEISAFLAALDAQSYRLFELIVVDQNDDDRLGAPLEPYRARFPLYHLRCGRGLSRARNVGLDRVSGEIVAFPDDDCTYPPDLLERVVHILSEDTTCSGVIGKVVDSDGHPTAGRPGRKSGRTNRWNVWRCGTSASIFLKRNAVQAAGRFDEHLGTGSSTPFASAEETDYLLRLMARGFEFRYDPSIAIEHPPYGDPTAATRHHRARAYGRGMGRVLRQHDYPLWFVVYQWLRALGGTGASLVRLQPARARCYAASLQGRIEGWLAAGAPVKTVPRRAPLPAAAIGHSLPVPASRASDEAIVSP